MWGIRLVEIALVAVVGVLAARVATGSRMRVPQGGYGASMLVASVFYFGYLPFQDSTNCEIWCAVLAVAATVAARDLRGEAAAAVAAGVLLALAFLAKPPALAFAPLAAHAWLTRCDAPRERRCARLVQAAASASLAFACVTGAAIAYFAAQGALGAMVDLTTRANIVFNESDSRVRSFGDWGRGVAAAFDWFVPWSYAFVAICAIALARAVRRRDRTLGARYSRPLAWAACAYVAIAVQRKLFVYHHGLFIVPCASLGALLWEDLAGLVRARFARPPLAAAAVGFAVVAIVSCLIDTPRDVWWKRAKNAVRYAGGGIDSHALVETFDSPQWIDLTNVQRAADFVRERSSPDDALLVRGYEPELYFFAHRRYGGRFFWSGMLVIPSFAYRRAEWLAQDRDELTRIAPAWAVTRTDGCEVDSVAWLEACGYDVRAQFGGFVVLARRR
jgi:hypothetical protein